jgi:nucleotide-binding universal stress UspA family protein
MSTVFEIVVCGVDATEEGVNAARAAARVTGPEGRLTLVAVEDPSPAVHAGFQMPQVLELLAAEAREALERGRAAAGPLHNVESMLGEGDPRDVLLAELRKRGATLAVVGTHGHTRVGGIALGSVTTHLLHEAPCAVLVARGAIDAQSWPRRIVVGLDGSAASAAGLDAARALADRFGAAVRVVIATDGDVDLEVARLLAPELEEHDARPLDVLNVASETSDLVVVGSRGLHGLRALGSVGERLAHEARCSVLVLRPAP